MSVSAQSPRELSAREYAGFQRLVAETSGITLTSSKRQLLVGRVARLVRERGLPSYGAYLEQVVGDASGAELVRLLDLVTTNETRFFRERGHYDFLEQVCYPAWHAAARAGTRPRSIRVWSAACSTGQEPCSIAMTLLHHFPASDGWTVEIFASDLSTRALEAAARGEYDVAKAAEIPSPYLKRFMRRGVGAQSGRMRTSRELRAAVRFSRVNLNEPLREPGGRFDLVFCSNALIYFSPGGRTAVVERLTGKLDLHGHLFVGHAESLHEHRGLLRSVAPTVYAHTNAFNA